MQTKTKMVERTIIWQVLTAAGSPPARNYHAAWRQPVPMSPSRCVFPERNTWGKEPADIPCRSLHSTAMDTPAVTLDEIQKADRMPIIIYSGSIEKQRDRCFQLRRLACRQLVIICLEAYKSCVNNQYGRLIIHGSEYRHRRTAQCGQIHLI